MRPEGQGEARAEVKGNKGVDEGAGGPSGPGLAGLGRRFLAGLQDLRLVRLVFADGSQLSGSRSLLDSVLCSDARHRKCGGAGRSVQNEIAGSTKPARASWIQIGPREPRAVSRRERPSSRPRPAPTNPATELPQPSIRPYSSSYTGGRTARPRGAASHPTKLCRAGQCLDQAMPSVTARYAPYHLDRFQHSPATANMHQALFCISIVPLPCPSPDCVLRLSASVWVGDSRPERQSMSPSGILKGQGGIENHRSQAAQLDSQKTTNR